MSLKIYMANLIALLNCPKCQADLTWDEAKSTLSCADCASFYQVEDGIIDFLPDYQGARGISQKAMENPMVSRIYENYFRPVFSRFGTIIRYRDEIKWLLDIVPNPKPQVIVDLACGSAKYGRLLAKEHDPGMVICVDLSMPMLEEAKKKTEMDGLTNLVFIRASIERLPVKSNSVDWLNCFGALHLFPDTSAAFKEIYRILDHDALFTCLTACMPTCFRHPCFVKNTNIDYQRVIVFKNDL